MEEVKSYAGQRWLALSGVRQPILLVLQNSVRFRRSPGPDWDKKTGLGILDGAGPTNILADT